MGKIVKQSPQSGDTADHKHQPEQKKYRNVRAFCRVFIGEMEKGVKHLERTLQHTPAVVKSSVKTSFIVVDSASIRLLKQSMSSNSAHCLYDRLQKNGVTFIHTNEIHRFLSENNKTDFFNKTMSLIKTLSFPSPHEFEYHQVMAETYKSLCLSYVFSKRHQ